MPPMLNGYGALERLFNQPRDAWTHELDLRPSTERWSPLTHIHADLTVPADVDAAELEWDASPAVGVHRKRIERNGDEVARLTGIIRYAPGSAFPAYVHGGVEEYLALDLAFSDANGDHETGVYVRNGIDTEHAPFTRDGCAIRVKLWWITEN
jgi:anti-sigma factor ChrR (cupin superfamily)